MLDSRRDCRYRGGAYRNIGVGLGKATFHNMLGTSSGVPGFPLTFIHPSAWKGNSPKFWPSRARSRPIAPHSSGLPPRRALILCVRTTRAPKELHVVCDHINF